MLDIVLAFLKKKMVARQNLNQGWCVKEFDFAISAMVLKSDWTPQDCELWFEQWVQLRIEASRDLQSQMWIWHAILTNYNKKRIQKSTSWNFFKCSYRYLFLSIQELINMECSFDFSKPDTSLKLWQDRKSLIFFYHPWSFLFH